MANTVDVRKIRGGRSGWTDMIPWTHLIILGLLFLLHPALGIFAAALYYLFVVRG